MAVAGLVTGAPAPDPAFHVEQKWKEEVVYREGARTYTFDAGWGVAPPVLYVPTAELWAAVMPPWLRDRRAEVLDRLRQRSGHVIEETTVGYGPASASGVPGGG